ncbi:hypothetical protein HJG53_10370 [Sphingomonas sp. ID1715]|uniref:hypothetical protein n=1 Tax=Sphingomonas sp. ID1715 TaxID=1656898 RepID=UPI001487B444|nr:hypothetical protein [Sphingomonas sp. ID1715]NNM77309.1 hypothetical protein [Sphingomonas sp. ID1715]
MSYLDDDQREELKPFRVPSILFGALVPLLAGYGVLIAMTNQKFWGDFGLSLLSWVPGLTVAFAVIALPVSLIFVLVMTGLAREWPVLSGLPAWMIGGPIVSSPLALAFGLLLGVWGACFISALSVIGGASAWMGRPADLRSRRTEAALR